MFKVAIVPLVSNDRILVRTEVLPDRRRVCSPIFLDVEEGHFSAPETTKAIAALKKLLGKDNIYFPDDKLLSIDPSVYEHGGEQFWLVLQKIYASACVDISSYADLTAEQYESRLAVVELMVVDSIVMVQPIGGLFLPRLMQEKQRLIQSNEQGERIRLQMEAESKPSNW